MKTLRQMVPQPAKDAAYRLCLLALDAGDALRGRRDPLVPPRRLQAVGGGDFKAVGREFLQYFIELGGLRPGERVLDVGCGIGRMAVPLLGYLDERGRYEGFDIVAVSIRWCQRHITPRHLAFRFQRVDLCNRRYNPRGRIEPSEFRFPYDAAGFDFVFLTSVFTHMFPRDIRHYLSEITRIMKPGGRCLLTFFLLNDESRRLISAGRSALDFAHDGPDGCRVIDLQVPERAVGLDEPRVLAMLAQTGLVLRQPVRYGTWCGRVDGLSFQDLLVAAKPPSDAPRA